MLALRKRRAIRNRPIPGIGGQPADLLRRPMVVDRTERNAVRQLSGRNGKEGIFARGAVYVPFLFF